MAGCEGAVVAVADPEAAAVGAASARPVAPGALATGPDGSTGPQVVSRQARPARAAARAVALA